MQRAGDWKTLENLPGLKIAYVQFSDVPRETRPGFALDRLPPGHGVVPFRETFALIAAKGYGGWMSYEAPNEVAWKRPPAEVAREALQAAQAFLPRSAAPRARSPPQHRANDPGRDLFLADAGELALGPLARGHRDHLLEDLTAHGGERRALEDHAAVDVHVLFHVAVHQRVRRQLQRRHRLAAEDRAAPGGEADHVAPARDQAGDRYRIVAGRVHEDEAARGDGLAVEEHVHHRRGAALGHAAERLLEDRRDATRLVARRRVVVHRLDAAAVPLPPLVTIDQLLGHALVDRPPDEQVLGAVDLGRFREHAGAAIPHQLIDRPAEGRVRGDPRVAVRAAAVRGEHQLRHRLPRPLRVVRPRQELGHFGGCALDGLPDAARLLDVHQVRLALGMPGHRHLLAVDHHDRLVHLAPEPDEDVGGHIRMLGVAGEHALERQMILAEELGATPRLVGDGDDAVDVRVVALDVAELVLHEVTDARGAVHPRDDRHVVARADTAVLPLVAVEVAHRIGGIVLHRKNVDAHLVAVGRELADVQIVAVDVIARGDVTGREADHLSVAPDRLAEAHGAPSDLVAGLDALTHLAAPTDVLQNVARCQLFLGDRNVVLGTKHDRPFGQCIRRHPSPRA